MPSRPQQFPLRHATRPALGDRVLLLQKQWLDKLMDGSKCQEVRGQPLQAGATWLGCKGFVYALAVLDNSRRVHTIDEFRAEAHGHRVFVDELPYKRTFLTDVVTVRALPQPVACVRQSGPTTWMRFAPEP